jgi:hypothetical protein
MKSGLRASDSKNRKACKTNSMSPELSTEIDGGLMNGASAPISLEIFAYSAESVETIVRLILFDLKLAHILHAIKGNPPSILMFLFGTPLEPDLAGISATM